MPSAAVHGVSTKDFFDGRKLRAHRAKYQNAATAAARHTGLVVTQPWLSLKEKTRDRFAPSGLWPVALWPSGPLDLWTSGPLADGPWAKAYGP